MLMTLRARRIALTAHVSCSVGWLGAVAGFLALAVTGLRSEDPQLIRAAYLAMDRTTWFVILPFAAASLLTGVISSIGTAWGLFRYYWVLVKLLITLFSTSVLLIHVQPIERLGRAAASSSTLSSDLHQVRVMMVVASGIALAALLFLTALSVYKPRGLTPYGARNRHAEGRATEEGTQRGSVVVHRS
jgi:hypothetical protein